MNMPETDTWAIAQISRLLPLDENSLTQIISYSSSISKDAAAEHLKNLLGDSPKALEFITSYNARREAPNTQIASVDSSLQISDGPPARKPRKKQAPLNRLPPQRRPDDYGNTQGAYQKKEEEDYMPGTARGNKASSHTFALSTEPAATSGPTTSFPTIVPVDTKPTRTHSPKPPPSAAGTLISSLPNVRQTTAKSRTASPARSTTPSQKTKISVSGGTSMHGASSTLSDLDSAIRALEIQTNPSLTSQSQDSSTTTARKCTCLATRHPLLSAAPNCLSCGKIICAKEGLGPCTFCGNALLSSGEIQSMLHALKEERGRERIAENNRAQKRPDVSNSVPKAFQQHRSNLSGSSTPSGSGAITPDAADSALAAAQAHTSKLLSFQAQNARRTHIIDQAADFETPTSGQSMWASPMERAAQLKRQQKVLREQEWNAKPEYEKRNVTLSLDVKGGKVTKRIGMASKKMEELVDDDMVSNGGIELHHKEDGESPRGTGAFGKNPLLGGLIKPKWEPKGKGKDVESDAEKENRVRNTWRRVQDDNDDNEAWILDGGIYGGRESERLLGSEERAVGGSGFV